MQQLPRQAKSELQHQCYKQKIQVPKTLLKLLRSNKVSYSYDLVFKVMPFIFQIMCQAGEPETRMNRLQNNTKFATEISQNSPFCRNSRFIASILLENFKTTVMALKLNWSIKTLTI